jgi:hypothetical protein
MVNAAAICSVGRENTQLRRASVSALVNFHAWYVCLSLSRLAMLFKNVKTQLIILRESCSSGHVQHYDMRGMKVDSGSG